MFEHVGSHNFRWYTPKLCYLSGNAHGTVLQCPLSLRALIISSHCWDLRENGGGHKQLVSFQEPSARVSLAPGEQVVVGGRVQYPPWARIIGQKVKKGEFKPKN